MTVPEAQARIPSRDFSEWMAFYTVEAEYQGAVPDRDPTPSELGAKLRGFATVHNAGLKR